MNSITGIGGGVKKCKYDHNVREVEIPDHSILMIGLENDPRLHWW